MLVRQGPSMRVYFKDFEFNLETRELYKHGLKIRIRGQPAEILASLISRPGEAVTRQALKQRLWPQGTFVDFEHMLNNSINKLRNALRDDPGAPRFIETLPGLGYRFIAPLSAPAPEPASRQNSAEVALQVLLRIRPNAAREWARRVAVLPFTSEGSDIPEYLAGGMSARLIVQLKHACRHIHVISPMSSSHRDGNAKSMVETVQELQADYVVIGTVCSVPPLGRVIVQLIRCADQCCTWGECFIRPNIGIFEVQDEIATEIARGLSQSLREIRPRVARRPLPSACTKSSEPLAQVACPTLNSTNPR